MQVGLFMLVTDHSMGIVDLAHAAEAAGFESLFVGEHTHMPVGTGLPGSGLGGQEARLLDPFAALSAAAAVTTRLRLGTGICLVVERDPIILAKEVATVDFLSGGRFLFGIGGGWNEPEMRNHGTNPAKRWLLLRERIRAMQCIWTEEAAEFHGKFTEFGPLWSWPKPVQRPHPPILIGGSGSHTLQRIVEYGDGWLPYCGRLLPDGEWTPSFGGVSVDDFIARGRQLRQLAQDAGRSSISLTLFGAPIERTELEKLRAAAVDRCLFWLPSAPAETVLPLIERCAEAAAAISGR